MGNWNWKWNSTWVWWLGLAVVLVTGSVAYVGLPDGDSNWEATGTIGAAKRHRSEQLTNASVVLKDSEVTALMQTALWDRLLKDPKARKLLTSQEVRAVMAEPAMQRVLALDGAARVFSDPIVTEALGKAILEEAQSRSQRPGNELSTYPDYGAVLRRRTLVHVEANPRVLDEAMGRAIEQLLANPAALEVLSKPEVEAAFRNRGIVEALSSHPVQEMMNYQVTSEALRSARFFQEAGNARVQETLARYSVVN